MRSASPRGRHQRNQQDADQQQERLHCNAVSALKSGQDVVVSIVDPRQPEQRQFLPRWNSALKKVQAVPRAITTSNTLVLPRDRHPQLCGCRSAVGLQSHEYADSLTRTRSSYPRTRNPHVSFFCRHDVGLTLALIAAPAFAASSHHVSQERRRAACQPSHPAPHRPSVGPARHRAGARNPDSDRAHSRRII